MLCLSHVEMEAYILSAPSAHNQQKAEHIASCPHCFALYHEQLEEQDRWSQELYAEALPDSFTAKVMAALEHEEVEHETASESLAVPVTQDREPVKVCQEQVEVVGAPPAFVNNVPQARGRKSLFKGRGARFWKLMIGAASLLLLTSTVILYSVPTLAETIRSLFVRDNVDIGLLRAQEFGLVEHPNIKVKDKGYTIKIDEAVADPTRVIIALQLFGPDGKHDRNRLQFSPGNSIKIKDDLGQVIGETYDMGMTNDFYYLVAFFPEPIQADKITIEGRINELGNTMSNIPLIQGKWHFDFSIDLREAKKKTTFTSLSGGYTATDGMTVRLKRLTRMVQGVRLELDTQLSEEALIRSPGELWKQQGLKFHFEDLQGEEIHSVNSRKGRKDSLITQSHIPGDKPGLMHWSYTFKYLPEDFPYRFVFDGYSVSETDNTTIEFEPGKLKAGPTPFHFDGDELMLRNFTVEPPPNTNGKVVEGALHLDGRLRNEFRYNEWVLRVPNDSKSYQLTMRGGSTTEATGWKDGYILVGGAQLGGLFEFRAPGLDVIPGRLQLTRTVVDRLYTNVDWIVDMNVSKNPQH